MEDRYKNRPLTEQPSFFLGDAQVDPPSLCIKRDGTSHRVEAKVMQVLLELTRAPGRVVSRQDLEREVWPGRVVTADAVTNAVVKLRKALNDNPRKSKVIETIAKSGYRLKIEPSMVVEDQGLEKGTAAAGTVKQRSWPRQAFVALLLIVAVAIFAFLNWHSPEELTSNSFGEDKNPSIAVIPFDVLGEDTSQTYFAEGITLDLITELSRLPGLLVIAPGTVFGYRETEVDDRVIASELGVLYLIRGGVQRAGDRVRINVRLLETTRGRTLWAERFVGDAGSVFQIQDEVVERIAAALQVRLTQSMLPLRRSGATKSIAAYDEFLRGQERYGRRTPGDNRVAQLHFERAIALDPSFARAYAGLALTWSRLAIDGWATDADKVLTKAAEYARKAAAIDPSIPQIQFVRAQVELFRGKHERAAAAATAAIELDPNYADAYALLAWILHYAGRPDHAWSALGEALKRNPNSAASYREIAGEIYFTTGRFQQAAKEFEAALERNPAHMRARLWFAATLLRLGQDEEAAWEVQELIAINPDFSLSRMLLAFPLKDPYQLDALTAALAQLGLPE